ITNSSDLPILNAFDSSYNGGEDIYIAKINRSGQFLAYCTYFGGSDRDILGSIRYSRDKGIYLIGETRSNDIPIFSTIGNGTTSIGPFIAKFFPTCDDIDQDGVCYISDNCPTIYNPEQTDNNQNGIGDECDRMCGDINVDGFLDIEDVSYLIQAYFLGGSITDPIILSDMNCDGKLDIVDIVVLIDFFFYFGNQPCCAW
ncbi:MAG: hypothetical protein ABIJ45_00975, partial [Candidatus Zixiibacteriota bacterium]